MAYRKVRKDYHFLYIGSSLDTKPVLQNIAEDIPAELWEYDTNKTYWWIGNEWKLKNIDVYIQDRTTEIIDLHFSKEIQQISIVTDTAIGDTTVTISSLAEPTNANTICFKEGNAFYQGTILSHEANGDNWDIVLDTPLDYAYTTATDCSKEALINLAVNGAITPQIFIISPKGLTAGVKWDITRILGVITDDATMDDGKFGGVSALTNGIVIRKVDGTYKNIFNAKTNGDLAVHMYDLTYIPATLGPAGRESVRFRRTFAGQEKAGVVIRLDASAEDELQCIIQDDLTALVDFTLIAQGHIVD